MLKTTTCRTTFSRQSDTMDRINSIYNHPVYRREAQAIAEDEKDRIFCRHGVDHLLEVARLCYLYCIEDGLIDPAKNHAPSLINREMIYAAALLHDIGRHQQRAAGIPHDQAGAQLARQIMTDAGFGEHEIELVVNAISKHRDREHLNDDATNLSKWEKLALYLARADKKSRQCFACDAMEDCNWPDEMKNMRIEL